MWCVMNKYFRFTHQNSVKSWRGSTSLHMTQDSYSCVKTKPLNYKLQRISKYSGFIIIILYIHALALLYVILE